MHGAHRERPRGGSTMLVPLPIPTELITDVTKRVGELFTNLLGPVTQELGLTFRDQVSFYRLNRLVALGEKTNRFLRGKAIPENPSLGKILPIIENGSREDDDDLHTRWAALLANTIVHPNGVHPAFAEILKQLTSEDVKFLDKLVPYPEIARMRYAIADCPSRSFADLYAFWYNRGGAIRPEKDDDSFRCSFLRARLENLDRLGLMRCVENPDESAEDLEKYETERFRLTHFALEFVYACTVPKKEPSPNKTFVQ